ncbi:MAG: toprim domain-containing protein [Pyramidobacter sp.]|nr:toprim domain-containing protein [Pyramidobacter sp.]
MAKSDRIERIKQRVSLLDYARSIGLPVHRPGDRCKSLAPGSTNPTAMLFDEDHWYDFKTGQGGDVIDLCAIARHGGDRGAAIRELSDGDEEFSGWVQYTQNLCAKVGWWQTQLRQEDHLYLKRRRINEETIKRLKLGFDPQTGRLTIPYFKNGYVAYVVTRERDGDGPKYKKDPLDGMNENIPWGLQTLDRLNSLKVAVTENQDTYPTPHVEGESGALSDNDPENQTISTDRLIVIAEGAFDAFSWEQEGYCVLSPMGGYFSRDATRQVLNVCKGAGKVFICFDSDGPGTRFQLDMAKLMFRHHINFVCGRLEGVKDISDYYAAGGDLGALIRDAEPGLKVLCDHLAQDRDGFKAFALSAGRFTGKPEMAELFAEMKGKFPPVWLNAVEKMALSPPAEDTIKTEIMEKYRLRYSDYLGFYEYVHGVWTKRTDTEIRKYVADALGQYQTGAKLGSILKLIQAAASSEEPYNRKPIFNFRNCILELETGTVREHRESDLSTVQVDYVYLQDAWSERWAQFVEEISNADDARAALLQEIAGYVLFNDCSLQKCFFLIGDGANGKSVFLDVLTEVFGRENVSNVSMGGLMEPFQKIQLLGSILNINNETSTTIKGAEEEFKKVVAGNMISGCYKNRDFISFQPRAKLISACNEYTKTRDTTIGFLRRVCFVAFKSRFVDDPGPGEYKADKTLTATLLRELPAIFNWCYAGYRALKKQQRFTITSDNRELMDNFTRLSNPILTFVEEEVEDGTYSRKRLYQSYKDWALASGHNVMSQTAFTQRFRQTISQYGGRVLETKYAGERQYIISKTAPLAPACPKVAPSVND